MSYTEPTTRENVEPVAPPLSSPAESASSGAGPTNVLAQTAGPVLQDAADAIGGTQDALVVDDGVSQLNSDGDQVYMRLTAEGKISAVVGAKGQYGGDITIQQNGDGAEAQYTVAVEKHALLAVTGTIPIPNLPLKGEVGVQTYDTVEMTFDTPEEAARAAKIVQRLAAADATQAVASAGSAAVPGPGLAGGDNPLANPLNESGAPNDALQDAFGITQDDRSFLQSNVTAYEQTVTGRARAAIEGKLPQLVSPLELGAEGRLDGRGIMTRRVELPTDTQNGELSYTVAVDARLSAKEKATLGINAGNQIVVGPTIQNRVEVGQAQLALTATYDLPAGTSVAETPVGGRPAPEINLIADGELGTPDRITAELSTEWLNQSPLTLSRGDSMRGSIALTIDDPADAPAALGAFVRGDPGGAAELADATLTAEIQSVARTGLNVQGGLKGQLAEGVKVEGTLIFAAGVDDVISTRRVTLSAPEGTDDAVIGGPAADARAQNTLVVTPRDGLTLRDAPGGDRTSVFQNGTFLQQTGAVETSADGSRWVPVQGTNVNDRAVEGYVSADYVATWPGDQGQMDETGRINPALERERYDAVTVAQGDTLWDIAQQHDADFGEMVALNADHLIGPGLVFEGDTVYLPGTARGAAPADLPAPGPLSAESVDLETESNGTSGGSAPASTDSPSDGRPSTPPPSGSGADDSAADRLAQDSVESGSGLPGGERSAPPMGPPAPADMPPAADQTVERTDLETLLREYQVPTAEMTTFRPGLTPEWVEEPARWIGDNLPILPGADRLGDMGERGFDIPVNIEEKRLLEQLGPLEQITWGQMSQDTYLEAEAAFPQPDGTNMTAAEWNNNGHTDAFRHALWNARMTREFGADWTEAYATAHEMVPGNEAAREAMDLYNNEVGRRIAVENPSASDAQLQQLITDAMNNGNLLVVDADGQLAWSDQVAFGEHGQAAKIYLEAEGDMAERNLELKDADS